MAPGYSASAVASTAYTIVSGATILVNDAAGFGSTTGLSLVGGAGLANNALQLSASGSGNNASAVWNATPVNVQAFTTDFYFSIQETSSGADGLTFTLQNAPGGLYALGGAGGGLGYQGIASSIAVKFDVYDNAGEGIDSSGFYTNGAAPTVPAADMSATVNLLGPHILHAHLTYDGTTLTLTLIDTVSGVSFTTSTGVNIPTLVGGNTAYAGFTAGTHAAGAVETILNWTYVASPGATALTATPVFTPAPGNYPAAQSVTMNDATVGAVIYYTTDGSVPSTGSLKYSGPVRVSADETLAAIAVASGQYSAVGSGAYQIAAALPGFMPAAGTYPGVQSVTKIYTYFKKFNYKTVVMGASFRNIGEIEELAGCDLLTISPNLLHELEAKQGDLPRKLDPAKAKQEEVEKLNIDKATFDKMHAADRMAHDKLKEGIEGFSAALVNLEKLLAIRLAELGASKETVGAH